MIEFWQLRAARLTAACGPPDRAWVQRAEGTRERPSRVPEALSMLRRALGRGRVEKKNVIRKYGSTSAECRPPSATQAESFGCLG